MSGQAKDCTVPRSSEHVKVFSLAGPLPLSGICHGLLLIATSENAAFVVLMVQLGADESGASQVLGSVVFESRRHGILLNGL